MKASGLYSMEEFLSYKNSKDITVDLSGDSVSISKFENEIYQTLKKNVTVESANGHAKVAFKDCFLDDVQRIAMNNGLEIVRKDDEK